MALARIITRFPEEAHELVESLRSRGFEVQTESPITAIPFIPQMNIEESETVGSEARAVSEQIESLPRHSFGMEAPRVEAAEFSATPISDLESQPLINENARAMISEPEHAAAEPLQPSCSPFP